MCADEFRPKVTLWSVRQTAEALGITPEQVRLLIEAKRIIAIKGRGRDAWRIPPSLLAWTLGKPES